MNTQIEIINWDSMSQKAITAFTLLLLSTGTASADFTIQIGNGDGSLTPFFSVEQGTTHIGVVIPVYAYAPANSPITENISGYNIAIDFGGNQYGIPQGFSSFSAVWGNDGFGADSNVGLDTSTADFINSTFGKPNFDFIISDTHSGDYAFTAGADPIKLFDLTFNIADNAIPGIYDIDLVLVTTPGPSFTNVTGLGGNLTGLSGSFEVTSVPEPSSFALMGLGVAGFACARRWKKRRTGKSCIPAQD